MTAFQKVLCNHCERVLFTQLAETSNPVKGALCHKCYKKEMAVNPPWSKQGGNHGQDND